MQPKRSTLPAGAVLVDQTVRMTGCRHRFRARGIPSSGSMATVEAESAYAFACARRPPKRSTHFTASRFLMSTHGARLPPEYHHCCYIALCRGGYVPGGWLAITVVRPSP